MKYLILVVFIIGNISVAQEKVEIVESKKLKYKEIEQVPIYPGCEKDQTYIQASDIDAKNKALMSCFQRFLMYRLNDYLDKDELSEQAQKIAYSKAHTDSFITIRLRTRVSFKVDTTGNIVDIKAVRGDEVIREQAIKAMEKIANRIRESVGIEPAKYEDGEVLDFPLSIPVVFQTEVELEEKKK